MLKNYLKMAWKVLLRRKFFTFVSLFGISLTLMVLVLVTAQLDSIISAIPPESRIDRILYARRIMLKGKGNINMASPSYYFLNRYVRSMKTPEMVSIYSVNRVVVNYNNNKKFKIAVKYTDADFWNILDFNFCEGRPYNKEEVEKEDYVAVVSSKMEKELFGTGSATGKTIELQKQKFRVVGVVGNVNKNRESFADVWLPVTTSKIENFNQFNYMGGHMAMLLAADKSDLGKIQKEFQAVVNKAEMPQPERFNKIVCPLKNSMEWRKSGDSIDEEQAELNFIQKALLLMTLFVMLPTINLINMNISRIMERSAEIAIRKSFGATSRSLVFQFLVENLVLTTLGSILGLVLGLAALNIINSLTDLDLIFSYRTAAYYIIITVFFGLLSGIFPAYRMSALKPVEGLKGGIR